MHNPYAIGEKLYFRPIEKEDFTERLLKWRSDPEVTRNLFQGIFPPSREALEEEYKDLIKCKNDVVFAVVDKETDTHIGFTGLYDISWVPRRAECRVLIGEKEFWGKGYGNELMEMIVAYGFDTLNLHKICAGVNVAIEAAVKYLERIGFKKEGLRRQELYRYGKYYDAYHMGVFREEFYAAMKALKGSK